MFFSHYWQRREPPVLLRGGDFHCRFTTSVKFYVLFLVRQKFFSRKTAGRITFSILVFIFPLEAKNCRENHFFQFQSSFSLWRPFGLHFPFKASSQSFSISFKYRCEIYMFLSFRVGIQLEVNNLTFFYLSLVESGQSFQNIQV